MPSIKRYMRKEYHGFRGELIFRAIKITDDNHHTVKLFAGDKVSFEPRVKSSKSRHTEYEVIKAKTARGQRICSNGDYIMRTEDGRFLGVEKNLFNSSYKETFLRIMDNT
jgi:hypothetical protein